MIQKPVSVGTVMKEENKAIGTGGIGPNALQEMLWKSVD